MPELDALRTIGSSAARGFQRAAALRDEAGRAVPAAGRAKWQWLLRPAVVGSPRGLRRWHFKRPRPPGKARIRTAPTWLPSATGPRRTQRRDLTRHNHVERLLRR